MTLLEKYYDMTNPEISKNERIVLEIFTDISDRRGLRQELDNIDEDIKNEILETWLEIIETNLNV